LRSKWKYLYCFVFNLAQTYIVCGFASYFEPIYACYAAVCLLVMMIPLTILAFFLPVGKVEYWHGFLITLIVMIWPAVLFSISNPGSWVYYVVMALLMLLFCVYVIYDTQRMIQIWMVDEVVPAAMMLYFDFVMLFIVLLFIFGKNR